MRRLILPARVRAIILPALALFALSACSPWQYMTVNSAQLTHNDYNQLVYENDTVRLIYDIAGSDGQVKLRIFNKTNQPLTIDWQRSAFVRNQQTVSFLNKDIIIHGHTIHYTRYTSSLIASFTLPDSAGFIPPGSEVSNDLPTLARTGPLQIYVPDSLPRKELAEANGIGSVKFRQVHYDEAGSPIRFSSYLTFSIGHDNKEFSLTNHFYVSDVYQADGGPENFSLYHGHGDQIYMRQKTYPEGLAESPSTASSGIR
jgi:hypothetical protein